MTTVTATIPAAEHFTGFTAVSLRFPADPVGHRITRLYYRPDGTEMGLPTKFDGSTPFVPELRPSCRPDSDPAERFHELSVPFALARRAIVCDRPQCYGGDGGC